MLILDNCSRILFVADPQILGDTFGIRIFSKIVNYDSDKHIHRTYKRAVAHVRPNVIVFLGDLMDEGSVADDEKFLKYLKRFREILPKPTDCQMIYIPGDNDIGGEREMVKPLKVSRFQQYFNTNGTSSWKINNNDNIYHINRITSEIPNEERTSEKSFNFFISHYSILSHLGSFCERAIERFKPQVIFVGDIHKSNLIRSSLRNLQQTNKTSLHNSKTFDLNAMKDNQKVIEIQVPSCSYRMGFPSQIGYGQAIIEDGLLHYSVLPISNRFIQLIMYLMFVCCFVICIICTKCKLRKNRGNMKGYRRIQNKV